MTTDLLAPPIVTVSGTPDADWLSTRLTRQLDARYVLAAEWAAAERLFQTSSGTDADLRRQPMSIQVRFLRFAWTVLHTAAAVYEGTAAESYIAEMRRAHLAFSAERSVTA